MVWDCCGAVIDVIILLCSGNEYTHVFGGDPMSGTFTRHIAACFKDCVHSCILDGEMVGYNPETKTIGRSLMCTICRVRTGP